MNIFVAGGTGYLGSRLIPVLLNKGHEIQALVRSGSEKKLSPGCRPVSGSALDETTYIDMMQPCDTFVHLVGVSHPSPAKAPLFRSVDLVSLRSSVKAAQAANIKHFVYLSVAQPAPVMKAYVESRREAEELIRSTGLNATFLRPWYVLGPGHYWAYVLVPFYWLAERFPGSRETAQRIGLVTLPQMIAALAHSVENPADGIRIVDVPAIRRF